MDSKIDCTVGTGDTRATVVRARNTDSAHLQLDSRVLIHPICVGQGDAILLEIQHENGQREMHLIDGGRGQKNHHYYRYLKDTLREHRCVKPPVKRKDAGNTLADRTKSHIELDSITITHPDLDHYEGINRLFEEFTITCPIITTTATYIYTEHTNPGITSHRNGEPFQPVPMNRVQHWFPASSEGGRQHTYIATLPKRTRVRIVRNPHFKGDLNQSSILTAVSLPCSKYDYDVVLTGDSFSHIIQTALNLEGKSVGVFQVPHHGSRSNYSSTAVTIAQCTQFYSSFNADIYLISHGDHRGINHPHKEVVTGIVTAAVEKRRYCKIVVTATQFDERKLALSEYKDIKNWRDYVEIYHFKQGTPYVTLDPMVQETPNGLQLFLCEQAQAMSTAEDKLRSRHFSIKKINRNGNSFFNAVSGALLHKYSRKITQMQLRKKLVNHLLKLKDVYYPLSELQTIEEYCQEARKYLHDGHNTPQFTSILLDAMAGALAMRIQVIFTEFDQKDKIFGPDHERSRATIQLVCDASNHYDYAVPIAAPGCRSNSRTTDSISAHNTMNSVAVQMTSPQHSSQTSYSMRTPSTQSSNHVYSTATSEDISQRIVLDAVHENNTPSFNVPVAASRNNSQTIDVSAHGSQSSAVSITSSRDTSQILDTTHLQSIHNLSTSTPTQSTNTAVYIHVSRSPASVEGHVRISEARHYTPMIPPSYSHHEESEQACRRQLCFSSTNDHIEVHKNRECCKCKLKIQPTDRLFMCKNTKCTVVTHYDCEYNAREKRRFVSNFKKCEHCRTCKECNEVMGRANVMCKICETYAHIGCVRKASGQIAGDYTCKTCREKLGVSFGLRSQIHHHRTVSAQIPQDISAEKDECCICKQGINPADNLFSCKNSKCTVATHYECEYKSREKRRFVKDFGKCEHCRTCKECNTVMGRANVMCRVCVSYAHVECVRKAPGQIEGDYVCKKCRETVVLCVRS